jgi:dihydrofolate reductase
MRSLIVSEFVTLDGVMEAPGGETTHPHTNWVSEFPGEEHFAYKYEEIVEAETLLIGRVTYESFAGAWPTYEGPFADKMNSMPKVVVSTTLSGPEWANTSVIPGDAVAGIGALKSGEGGPILVAGSCTLVHTLLEHDLVDELRLMVFPISIGAGLRVFPDDRRKVRWELMSTRSFPNGVRLDVYRPE